jgi:hypothetical protein
MIFVITFSLLYHIVTTKIELMGTEYDDSTSRVVSSVKSAIIPDFNPDDFKKYNFLDTEIEYHETPEQISMTENINDPITIKYTDGTSKIFKFGDVAGSPIYYKPGAFKYGAKTYVPTYEDSIYLSKYYERQSKSSYSKTPEYYNFVDKICRVKNKNECKASSDCILINDDLCTAGDNSGPYLESTEYNKDVDYYYYKNKCYGLC